MPRVSKPTRVMTCGNARQRRIPFGITLRPLNVRTALILLLGVLCGAAITTLTTLAEHNLTTAGLAGLTAASGAIVFFHKIIGPETPLR